MALWPPKTYPRPSLGPRPAIEEFRLRGGIDRGGAENAEGFVWRKVKARAKLVAKKGGWTLPINALGLKLYPCKKEFAE